MFNTKKSKELAKYQAQRTKCRDALEGQEAIHSKGTLYLPALQSQSKEDYEAYKQRAVFYNATSRVTESIGGVILRKQPTFNVELNEKQKLLIEDLNLRGENHKSILRSCVQDCLIDGGCCYLVDYTGQSEQTKKEEEAVGDRAYIVKYSFDDVLSWRFRQGYHNGKLEIVILQESFIKVDEDGYNSKTLIRYRCLKMVDGVYIQEVLTPKNDIELGSQQGFEGTQFDIVKHTPTMNGNVLTEIPFFFINYSGRREVQKPLMIDFVNMNISHYITTADLELGCYYTASPSLFLKCMDLGAKSVRRDLDNQDEKPPANVVVGGGSVLSSPSQHSDAKYVEFTGQGLQALVDRLKEKEQQMSNLGTKLLDNGKGSVESAKALQIRKESDMSTIKNLSQAVSHSITQIVRLVFDWSGEASPEFEITLNTDFTPEKIEANELTALSQMFQAGALPKDVYFHNLRRGEVIPEGYTFEEFDEQLRDDFSTFREDEDEDENEDEDEDDNNDKKD